MIAPQVRLQKSKRLISVKYLRFPETDTDYYVPA
jgi:hypothetical protein